MTQDTEIAKFCRYSSHYRPYMLEGVYRIIAMEVGPLYPFITEDRIVVFDVGGNVGSWAKSWLDIFGDVTEKYYIFEPLTVCIAEIAQRTRDGFFDDGDLQFSRKMVVRQCAVGNEPGELTINYTRSNTGLASAVQTVSHMPGRSVELPESETVPVVTLDGFCAEQGIERIDVLKIDVEGFELQVLQGAMDMIAGGKIGMILFEFGLHQIASRHFFIDFWTLFEEHGYEMHRFGLGRRGWGLQKLDKYSGGLEEMNTINFFMARPKA